MFLMIGYLQQTAIITLFTRMTSMTDATRLFNSY